MPSNTRRHEGEVSRWDQSAAANYDKAKHGPDGARFLDPHLYALMGREQLENADFLDLGAGTGPWSEHARNQGARTVTALDLNMAMLKQAQVRLGINGLLPNNVGIVQGNVARLPFGAETFDRQASINVGCNLPDQTFQTHFQEARRVARPGGHLIVTAPDSLFTPFTNVDDARDIQAEVDGRWAAEKVHDTATVKRVIDSLRYVLRATFVLDETGKPILVTEETADLVQEGTPTIRRIPGLAVDNNHHTAEAYIRAAEQAGWKVQAAHRDSFANEAERDKHNKGVTEDKKLGPQYVGNSSFLVMDLEK